MSEFENVLEVKITKGGSIILSMNGKEIDGVLEIEPLEELGIARISLRYDKLRAIVGDEVKEYTQQEVYEQYKQYKNLFSKGETSNVNTNNGNINYSADCFCDIRCRK